MSPPKSERDLSLEAREWASERMQRQERQRQASLKTREARTEAGRRPLMETATDKRGRTYERRRRPLSNTSINMMITLLGQILQQAVDYELIDRNPVRVGGRSARFLKRARPDRTFLEVDEFHALLDAAGELEAEAPTDLKGLGRRAMIATLGLAGLPDQRADGPEGRAGRSAALAFQARRREDRGRRAGGRDHALPARRAARLRDGPAGARAAARARPTTSSAPRPAAGAIPTASATGSSPAPSSAPTQTARRAAWRRCRRSHRTRCGAHGRRSAR